MILCANFIILTCCLYDEQQVVQADRVQFVENLHRFRSVVAVAADLLQSFYM